MNMFFFFPLNKPAISSNICSSAPVGASSVWPSEPVYGSNVHGSKLIRPINVRAIKPTNTSNVSSCEPVGVRNVRPSEPKVIMLASNTRPSKTFNANNVCSGKTICANTSVQVDLSAEISKLRFLLIYENMLKSIATARSECTAKQENKTSYNTSYMFLIWLTSLAAIEKEIKTQVEKRNVHNFKKYWTD